jgi:hypothetical protein
MQHGHLAQWLSKGYISIMVGEVPGSNPWASPFWIMVITKMNGGTNHFKTWRIH